tara:strand:- start:720 stop:2852 length:2133 start_codon:yes stop_codon:yes gene_type:complete
MRFFFVLLLSIELYAVNYDYIYIDRDASYNSFGQTGLIQTPSAETNGEGSVAIVINSNNLYKYGTITVAPFDWLETSYFYYRPIDIRWEGDLVQGHFLDKGFNVKFSYNPKNTNLPTLAIGLDDIAGTGTASKEYLVSTFRGNAFVFSLGIGSGKFAGKSKFKNPLSYLSDSFDTRRSQSLFRTNGGNLSYDTWFKGDTSIFGGIEWFIPNMNGLKAKIELDPFDYEYFTADGSPNDWSDLRKKKSNINYGLSYPVNKYLTIDTSYIRGNSINITFSIGSSFKKPLERKKKFRPEIKNSFDKHKDSKMPFYKDILKNLNNNKIFLQTAEIQENKLKISISSSEYRNPIRKSSYAAYIASEVSNFHDYNFNRIEVTDINVGVEINKISFKKEDLSMSNVKPIEFIINNTVLAAGNKNSYLENEFKPTIDFPQIFSSTRLGIESLIGVPEKFYFGGLVIKNTSEIQFTRNLLLSSEFHFTLAKNFQDTIAGPGSDMEHVRTDLVKYLKESDYYIAKMQLDYIWSPSKNTYAKLSGGIFEKMYGGIGGEFVYKPFNNNLLIGLEIFHVKKRAFDQSFKFLDYSTNTGHLNFSYFFINPGIKAKLSYGKYLAKDQGYTFDLSRTTKSGFTSGFYFTRTNVSKDLFGEGSFDKGFYFKIPLDLFSNSYSTDYLPFKLSPLTRDGGAKLYYDKELSGLIYNSSYNELNNGWDGFLD